MGHRLERLLVLALLSMLLGCHGGLQIPDGWVRQEPVIAARLQATAWDEADEAVAQASEAPMPDRLQIFVCYGVVLSNHVTLRLSGPDRPTLFWDPGGSYLGSDPEAGRTRDLVLNRPPTPDEWWAFRRDQCYEPFMLMFEWDLPRRQAAAMHQALRHEPVTEDATERFATATRSGACSLRLSSFLQQFGGDVIDMPRRWFWPHGLAHHLWTQSPDRVWVYQDDQAPQIMVPRHVAQARRREARTTPPFHLHRFKPVPEGMAGR